MTKTNLRLSQRQLMRRCSPLLDPRLYGFAFRRRAFDAPTRFGGNLVELGIGRKRRKLEHQQRLHDRFGKPLFHLWSRAFHKSSP